VVSSIHVTNSHGLVLLMSLYFLFLPLQVAGDTILWRTMDKADTGSYTSTVALVRNFSTGTVIAISGFLIKWTGSYIVAFWFGFGLSSVALVVFFIYRNIMRDGRAEPASIATGHEPDDIKKPDSHLGASRTPSVATV
jgi:hypothetical protein